MAISDIDPASPASNDQVVLGDDQIRGLKQDVVDSWGGIDGLVLAGTGNPAATAADMTSLFDRLDTVEGGVAGVFTKGMIMMWTLANGAIPAGWVLCDGTPANGVIVPDLRDRFVVGAGSSYGDGSTGGALPGAQTTDPAGSHTHTTSDFQLEMQHLPSNLGDNILVNQASSGQSDNHSDASAVARGAVTPNAPTAIPMSVSGANSAAHNHGATAPDGTHSHTLGGASLPPYYAITFICFVGT